MNTKEDILQAGLDVMYLHGYNGTGVKDIVDAAGIPKGSFYNYFESKEEFAIECLESISKMSCCNAESILLNDKLPPLDRLENYFRANVDKSIAGGYKCGCFLGNLTQELADVNEAIRVRVNAMLEHSTALIEDCLRSAQHQGQLKKDYDIRQLAEFIFNAWEGTLLRMKGAKNDKALESFMSMLSIMLRS